MKTHAYLSVIKEVCCDNHCNVDQIYEKIKETCPKVGRSTVYRNVEEMSKEGILTKLSGIGDKSIYELTKGNHIHLIDTETGMIKDLDIDNITIPGLPKNFKIEFSDIKLFGKF
ncbi:MAG: transcriptional repressor [Candidatus Gracilibacteria bacterium]|nr:transcriptional repressor [Candidatus Gracilibacteria bacterium]